MIPVDTSDIGVCLADSGVWAIFQKGPPNRSRFVFTLVEPTDQEQDRIDEPRSARWTGDKYRCPEDEAAVLARWLDGKIPGLHPCWFSVTHNAGDLDGSPVYSLMLDQANAPWRGRSALALNSSSTWLGWRGDWRLERRGRRWTWLAVPWFGADAEAVWNEITEPDYGGGSSCGPSMPSQS